MPKQSIAKRPAEQVEQAKKILLAFYQKPIAQISTELFFTIGAIIFFALFAIRPTIVTMTDLVKEIEDKEKTAEALKRKVTALNTVTREYTNLQNQFYLLEEAIPSEPKTDEIVAILEKVASELQLSITSLQLPDLPLRSAEPIDFSRKEIAIRNITINVSGNYNQIKQFIDILSNIRPILGIESVTITRKTSDQESSFISATIRVQSYHYGPKQKSAETENQQEENPTSSEEEIL